MNRSSILAVAVATGLIVSASANAHDIRGLLIQQMGSASPQIEAALDQTPTSDVQTRSVLYNLQKWPVPRVLTVCFLSGSPALRKRVSESMQRVWPLATLTPGRLAFDPTSFSTLPDCGASPSADIRIDFKNGDGYWSYVGLESRRHVPSMNLGGFTEANPDTKELDRLVGHETGHALGLEHEHQSPASPDCGWNFPYIRQNYVWKNDEDMYANFDKLTDYIQNGVHVYDFSTYDKKSLMHYDFEPEAFLKGSDSKCFITRNEAPSDQDKRALRKAYGPLAADSQTLTRGIAPSLRQKFAGDKYTRVLELLQTKVDITPQ